VDEADRVLILDEAGKMCALGTAEELREQGHLEARAPSEQTQTAAAADDDAEGKGGPAGVDATLKQTSKEAEVSSQAT
jgi:hypothetical protein